MRIRQAWEALWGKESVPATSERGPKMDEVTQLEVPWKRAFERESIWKDIDALDKDNPAIARSLDFIARFSTQFVEDRRPGEIMLGHGPELGFKVESPVEAELRALAPLIPRLQEQAFETVRGMLKFGDLPHEVITDQAATTILNVKMFPYGYQVRKNVDRYGSLMNGDPQEAMNTGKTGMAAYDQIDDAGNLLAAWGKYGIATWSFGYKQGLPYTEPILGCAISRAKRLTAIEDGLSVARLISAYPARVHHIPAPLGINADEAMKKVKQYKDTMSSDTVVPYDTTTGEFRLNMKNAPPAVDTDIYVIDLYHPDDPTKVVKSEIVNLEAQNPNLDNLEDVNLLIRFLLCALGVPADYLNLAVGQRAFIDKTTPEKREAFLYLCCAVQTAYVTTIRWLLDIQLLLHGINPVRAKYEVIVPRISPREAAEAAKIDLTRSNTAAIWRSIGIPKDIIGGRHLQMTPQEIEAWEQGDEPEPPDGKTEEETAETWANHVRLSYLAAGAAAAQRSMGGMGYAAEATE